MRNCCWFALAFFFVPNFSYGALTFSEIAWMGSTESANHEWIELYNDGPAVDVSGWVITDEMNLLIQLEGTVPGSSRVVLERTSDDSAPGTAFLIYTGALINSGATLKLVRADGSVEDQVAGGESWGSIGGDNTTKETAQYTDSGWVTAYPTPGSAPIATAVAVIENSEQENTPQTHSVSKTKKDQAVHLTLPDITLSLDLDTPEIAYVNQDLNLTAHAAGAGDTIIGSLQYSWNFGDGTTGTGREVSHIYNYPGTYIITAFAEYKRQHATIKRTITVLPVSISLTQNNVGDVQVNNDSPYELDLSGYELVGEDSFVFPPRTFLLANQTITIPINKLGNTTERMLALYDTEKLALAMIVPEKLRKEDKQVPIGDLAPVPPRVDSVTYYPAQEAEIVDVDRNDRIAESKIDTTYQEAKSEKISSANKQAVFSSIQNTRIPYVLLLVTVLLAVFGIYLAPRNPK